MITTRQLPLAAATCLGLALLTACASEADPAAGEADTAAAAVATEVTYDEHGEPEGLHRHKRWSEKLGQGAQPAGEVAFQNLAALGYTTVVSVDGARPDVELAGKYGLRYVHAPIGYDGVPAEQALVIIKAVEISEGPTYVHCHHGKHRGPAGVMVARITIDGISNEQAVQELKDSGCSPVYAGLYSDISEFTAPTAEQLAGVSANLPSVVEPDGLTDAMVGVSNRWEGVKLVRDAGWKVPPSNPDIAPAHEATMLWESLRETMRLDESKEFGEKFMEIASVSESAADQLHQAIRKTDGTAAEDAFGKLKQSCKDCHVLFRN